MNKSAIATVLIVVLAIVAGWQALHASNLQADLEVLQNAHDKLVKEHQEQIDLLNRNITRLERELRDAQSQSNLAKAEKLGTELPADTASGAQGRGGALGNFIRQRLASPEAQTLMTQMAYSQRYGAFISSLKLPSSVESALKQKIMDILNRAIVVQQKVANGETVAGEQRNFSVDKEVNAVMREYLNQQQMDAFLANDAKRLANAGNQIQAAISLQLSAQAPGLTEQNRAIVANAITKAMTNAGANNPGGQVTQAANLGTMLEQVEYSLQGTMEEGQMKIARDFLRQRAQLLNMVTQ